MNVVGSKMIGMAVLLWVAVTVFGNVVGNQALYAQAVGRDRTQDTESSAGTAEQNDADRGLEIAVEADRRDTGFGDFTAEFIMTLKNRQGQESIRYIYNKVLEVRDDGDKSLLIFDRPRDIKGTALLTYSHKEGPDDQWLFLPALRRVKRIAAHNKSGPFMGSEFAFEDLISEQVENYTYKYLRDETYDGTECYVIERYPADPSSGYTRQVVWYDKGEYRINKIEYYDRKNDHLKTLTYHDYMQYLGKYWRAHKMVMNNHQTGKSTRSEWKNFKFKTGLSDRDFDKNRLQRVR